MTRIATPSQADAGRTAPNCDVAACVAEVPDPELPMLTIGDLGILRSVRIEGSRVLVTITPTYLGCPALAEIRHDIRRRVTDLGHTDVDICVALSPPWTSDWITTAGRRKLAAAGLAPPVPAGVRTGPVPISLAAPKRLVSCPKCGSPDTRQRAAFASTACRALYECRSCDEPFEYVKEI